MARCEDYPCCGHEAGCCPDYDESGTQLNMRCVCGAVVPLSSHSSLCSSCLRRGDDEGGYDPDWDDGEQYGDDGDYPEDEDSHFDRYMEDQHLDGMWEE